MSEFPHPHHNIMRGIALRVAAGLVFSMMMALLKLAATWGAGLAEIVFFRSVMGLIVVSIWVVPREGLAGIKPRRPMALLGRNVLGVLAMLASFQAIVLLPLAESTTIGFTAPIFATLLSWLILREHVGPHRWVAALVAFLGVVVVMRPGSGGADAIAPLGVVFALTGALFGAGVTIALRYMAGLESVGAIVFWFQISAALVGGIMFLSIGTSPSLWAILILIVAGLFGGVGQIWMTESLHAAPVSAVAPFDYVQLILVALLGWLLIGTQPTPYTWAGAALIGGSGLYTMWRERRLHRETAVSATPPHGLA
jgi:drug/metabolite transporter (DMT)-like permease